MDDSINEPQRRPRNKKELRKQRLKKAKQQYQEYLDNPEEESQPDPKLNRPAKLENYPDNFKQVSDLTREEKEKCKCFYNRGSDSRQDLYSTTEGGLKRCKEQGLKIRKDFVEFANGKKLEKETRSRLHAAIRYCETTTCWLVTSDITRLMRNYNFDAISNPNQGLTVGDIPPLLSVLGNTTVVLLNSFCDDALGCRTFRKELSDSVRPRKNGRPKRNLGGKNLTHLSPIVRELLEGPKSTREVSAELKAKHKINVSHVTVFEWRKILRSGQIA